MNLHRRPDSRPRRYSFQRHIVLRLYYTLTFAVNRHEHAFMHATQGKKATELFPSTSPLSFFLLFTPLRFVVSWPGALSVMSRLFHGIKIGWSYIFSRNTTLHFRQMCSSTVETPFAPLTLLSACFSILSRTWAAYSGRHYVWGTSEEALHVTGPTLDT